jgi:hypothetical protein
MIVSATHRPAVVPVNSPAPVMGRDTAASPDLSNQIAAAVAKASVKIREQVQEEDRRTMKAAMEESERRHDRDYRALMVAMEENLTVMQKRLSTYTMLASSDPGVRQ